MGKYNPILIHSIYSFSKIIILVITIFILLQNLKGEVYKVDQQTLQELDVLENHPTLYERELQEVKSSDGTLLKVWIYLLKTFKPEMLELEFYDCYESKGEHGKVYISRYLRESSVTTPENI
jgi:gamma-glutamylaminecyclotransferase